MYGDKNHRISLLTQKLNSINNQGARIDHNNYKLNEIEIRLKEMIEVENSNFNFIKEDINSIRKIIEEEKQKLEFFRETKLRDLDDVESRIDSKVQEMTLLRDEGERRLISMVDDRFNMLMNEVRGESARTEETLETLSQVFDQELNKASEDFNYEKNQREENDELIQQQLSEDVSKLKENIEEQRNQRESSEQAVYELLKEVVAKVKVEIDQEKKDREKSEESILSLLEETCSKIHELSQNY